MTDLLPDIDQALYTALCAGTAVTMQVGGTTAPRIYNHQAPAGVSRPFILFYEASTVVPNRTPHHDLDSLYRVEVVADTRATAEAIRGATYAALHRQTLTVSGYSNYQLEATRNTSLVDNIDGKQVFRRVMDVRIRLSKEG